jgi:hypothetical protein
MHHELLVILLAFLIRDVHPPVQPPLVTVDGPRSRRGGARRVALLDFRSIALIVAAAF